MQERFKRRAAAKLRDEYGEETVEIRILTDAAKASRHLSETRCMSLFLLSSYIILPSVSQGSQTPSYPNPHAPYPYRDKYIGEKGETVLILPKRPHLNP